MTRIEAFEILMKAIDQITNDEERSSVRMAFIDYLEAVTKDK